MQLPIRLPCRAVLIDLDGTLVDSTPVVVAGWAQFAARHGLGLDEVLAYSHGRVAAATLAQFLPGHDLSAELAERVAYEESQLEGVTAAPGAHALLAMLQARPWAIVTSAWRTLAEARLAAAGLPTPPLLVPADEIRVGKPDPEGYLLAAAQLNVEPRDCVVIEDAPAGVEAARRAGMPVIALQTTTPAARLTGAMLARDLRDLRIDAAVSGFAVSIDTQRQSPGIRGP
jgi:mannitol-1-/sugar-/sorbitol-6-phosphatase